LPMAKLVARWFEPKQQFDQIKILKMNRLNVYSS
jgi:hypothetical protein